MPYSLIWLPEVLLGAGLKVAEVPGWQNRGRAEFGELFGVLCHHTAGPKSGNMPSLHTIIDGRPDLRGPLAQLGLGRDGTYYVIAAGMANHAGAGIWAGVTQGNQHLIGIEAENDGVGEKWQPLQLDAYQHGVAAILKHAKLGAERCAGHKEYALPRNRKQDPSFDMPSFREAVALILRGAGSPLVSIPAAEPQGQGRGTLRRGSVDGLVSVLQKALRLPSTGTFDAQTEASVREFQRQNGLAPDGIFGPKSWAALDARGASIRATG
jgi:peptidoglycan hydrolase-like protein with peptidoglycan-binding domain